MRKLPIVLLSALLVSAALLILWLAENLPGLVAVHFNAAGTANGFMTREGCRTFMLTFTLGAPAFVVAVTALLPRLIPTSMINIPNRLYWLAPERSEESLAFLSEQGVWFGCILLVFLSSVDWMLVKANASTPPNFPATLFTSSMVAFFGAAGFWTLRMLRHFRLPP
jgi:hypothetical protein